MKYTSFLSASFRDLNVHLSHWTLAFIGSSKHLEKEYKKHALTSALQHIRKFFLIAFGGYMLFGILDGLLLPDQAPQLWIIRYAITTPCVLFAYVLTYTQYFQKYFQGILSIIIGGAGLSTVFITLLSPPPISYMYYTGIVLILVFGYAFLKVRFLYATITGWILVLLYECLILFVYPVPYFVFLNNTFFFVIANVLGMLFAYYLERSDRREFVLKKMYEQEHKKVQKTNNTLEKRVRQRTQELKKTNTLLKEKNRKLEREEQIKNDFLDIASHELRTPLTVTKGYLSILKSECMVGGSAKAQQYMETIFENNERLIKLVNDMLSISRMEAGKEPLEIHKFSSRQEFQKFIKDLSLLANEKNITLTLGSKQDVLLETDIGKFRIIFTNLIANAIKHIPDGRTIEVSWKKEKNTLVAWVSDTGDGMTEEQTKNVFEKFYQGENARTRILGGNGLGLSITKIMIETLGGDISVTSTKGQGTSFRVVLPLIYTKK